MIYPGYVVMVGEKDKAVVAAIAVQLKARGYPPPAGTAYDAGLASLVKLFQSQHVDAAGRPLRVDGKVGLLTWGALFGAEPVATVPTGLAGAALGNAISQIGVMESPPGSNRGPMVDQYLKAVGAPPGSFWCMAFVNWCFQQAAKDQAKDDGFPKTAGCIDAWNRVKGASPGCIVTRAQAIADPSLVRPGFVFILDHGGGHGHTGFVKQGVGGALRTIEGNSNNTGSANGVGVFELNRRTIMDKDLKGFLDFTGA